MPILPEGVYVNFVGGPWPSDPLGRSIASVSLWPTRFLVEPGFKDSAGRLCFLDADEAAALVEAAAELLRTVILVGLHAGLRVRSEALPLTWADVDSAARRVDGAGRLREERFEPQRSVQFGAARGRGTIA